MKNKIVNTLIIVGFVALNIYYIYQRKTFESSAYAKLDEREKFWENKVEISNELQRLEIKWEHSPMSKQAQVQQLSNAQIPIQSVFKGSSKLVFCIPEGVCNVCYDSLYSTFNKMATEIGVDNIVILVPNDRLREIHTLFSESVLKDCLYGITSKELGFTVQGAYLPYLFITDSTLYCKNLYLPHKNEQGMTDYYLNTVKERYFASLITK